MPRTRKTPSTYKPDTPLNRPSNNPRNKANSRSTRTLAPANKKVSRSNATPNRTSHNASQKATHSSNRPTAVKSHKSISIADLFKKSPKIFICLTVIAILLISVIIDAICNSDKIYTGISVGDVDVSGLTIDEAGAKISEHYRHLIDNKSFYIFTDEDAYNSINIDDYFQQKDVLAEQISAEEDRANTKIVVTNSTEIGASINSYDLAKSAFEIGKHFRNFERISTQLTGKNIPVSISYGDGFDEVVSNINDYIGDAHVDYNVEFNGSEFVTTPGKDGHAIDYNKLSYKIETSLLDISDEVTKILITPEYDPIVIDENKANSVRDKLNAFCKNGATFTYGSNSTDFKMTTLASWVATKIEASELKPYFDYQACLKDAKSKFNDSATLDGISIENNDGSLQVKLENDVSVPDYSGAIDALNSKFDNFNFEDNFISIDISASPKSNNFTFDEAVNYGILRKLSYYTTTFTSTRSTQNRNHNIRLVSDILNNTVIKPNDEFSFLGTAGEMTEEDGFLEAGAMSNGEVVQSVAGGVCQVATTVFNAAYDAGLDIAERHNHQMVISSYPTGLDAAVNVPDQDLRFVNDTTSDVLLTATYTDTSITITLYGSCEKRNIETEKTEYKTEKKYSTAYEETANLSSNKWQIKTKGVDGSSITATRTVKLQNGKVLHSDAFYSYYIPTNEVVLVGEGSDISKIKQERENSDKDN